MEPPVPPQESDCCNSDCNPCILDVYESELKKYQKFCQNGGNLRTSGVEIVNCLSLTSYTKFSLTEKKLIAPQVFLFKFVYSDKADKPNYLEYKPGQYLLLKVRDHNGEFTRAYTPIPVENSDDLSFTMLARLYDDGRMSIFLKRLQIGQDTLWRGPYGDFNVQDDYKYLLFIAQGTGIAPLFTIISSILQNEEFESFVKLFFCCRNCDDILLRERLYEFSSYWNFSYEVFLSDKSELKPKYKEILHETKLTEDVLRSYTSGKNETLQVIICGSDKFNENIKMKVIELGIERSHIYLF